MSLISYQPLRRLSMVTIHGMTTINAGFSLWFILSWNESWYFRITLICCWCYSCDCRFTDQPSFFGNLYIFKKKFIINNGFHFKLSNFFSIHLSLYSVIFSRKVIETNDDVQSHKNCRSEHIFGEHISRG